MAQQLLNRGPCWPYIAKGESPDFSIFVGWFGIVGGTITCCLVFPLFLIPISFLHLRRGQKLKEVILEQRRLTLNTTNSVLMSKAEYVGGHPLIPHEGSVVLGLSKSHLTIYHFGGQHNVSAPNVLSLLGNEQAVIKNWLDQYVIQPVTSIPLKDMIQAGLGRPKSAREVYDEDYGYTIDVYEHSPFLSVIFKLNGGTYRASFQSFDSETPQKFYNQITALKYQLQSGSGQTS